MYYIIKIIAKIVVFMTMKFKIFYWKLKYGKRLKVGKNLKFRKRFNINIQDNGYVEIGDNNFFNNDCSINCHKEIIIGNNNLFGENVKIYDHNHIFNNKAIDMSKSFKENTVIIGNNNWFGTNSIILSKTLVGNYNVIAAGVVLNYKIDNENLIKQEKFEKINFINQ